ncbi:hypothetical protein [Pyrobaculum sp.]|uniref:hypothetical protein n=1 Tax=Pyrobaculum sp. TaxID=2004705 RepID=UPI003D121383
MRAEKLMFFSEKKRTRYYAKRTKYYYDTAYYTIVEHSTGWRCYWSPYCFQIWLTMRTSQIEGEIEHGYIITPHGERYNIIFDQVKQTEVEVKVETPHLEYSKVEKNISQKRSEDEEDEARRETNYFKLFIKDFLVI